MLLIQLPLLFALLQSAEPQLGDVSDEARGAWPQWRGPTRDGQSTGPDWPQDLSPDHLEEIWRSPELGPSYSGPVVDETNVYTTETVDEEFEAVRALDRTSGRELWRAEWTGAMEVPFFAARNGSWIRSTPAVDSEFLFVAGMRDVLKCFDKRSGELRWSVDFTKEFEAGLPPFGCVSSPLLTDEHVYIQAGASLVKLNKQTGAALWRAMVDSGEMMSAGSFSSPVLAELGGRSQLVAQSRTDLAGIDTATGETLWSTPVKAFRGMNILTPTVIGDEVFTSSYGGRSYLFQVAEGKTGFDLLRAWDGPAQGYMTSPVVIEGHAYLFLQSNRFGCVDLESGEHLWSSPPTGDSYWSLAVQGDRILALSDAGRLRMIQADPAGYSVISERQVVEAESWAHVAPAGNELFVRTQDSLVAFRWK